MDNDNCEFSWTTEIEPEIFAEGIHQGMLISLKEFKKCFLDGRLFDAFLQKALEQANLALRKILLKEAILVKNNEVLSEAHNLSITKNDPSLTQNF